MKNNQKITRFSLAGTSMILLVLGCFAASSSETRPKPRDVVQCSQVDSPQGCGWISGQKCSWSMQQYEENAYNTWSCNGTTPVNVGQCQIAIIQNQCCANWAHNPPTCPTPICPCAVPVGGGGGS